MEPTRLQRDILLALNESSASDQKKLGLIIGSSQPAISRALKALTHEGYVTKTSEGYTLTGKALIDFPFIPRDAVKRRRSSNIENLPPVTSGFSSTYETVRGLNSLAGFSRSFAASGLLDQMQRMANNLMHPSLISSLENSMAAIPKLAGMMDQYQNSIYSDLHNQFEQIAGKMSAGTAPIFLKSMEFERRVSRSMIPLYETAEIIKTHSLLNSNLFDQIARQTQLNLEAFNDFSGRIIEPMADLSNISSSHLLAINVHERAANILRDSTSGGLQNLELVEEKSNKDIAVFGPTVYDQLASELIEIENYDQAEFLYDENSDIGYPDLPSYAYAKEAHKMLNLRRALNKQYQRSTQEVIFKATQDSETAHQRIPQYVTRNESEFRNFVGDLYKVLYEASGEFGRLGPILSEEDLKKLLKIKFLRHDFDHDSEHGEIKDIRTKHRRVGEIFIQFSGSSFPSRKEEWLKIQKELLVMIIEVLESALGSLRPN